MNDTRAYLNGQFLPLSQARVPVLDRGFLFGDGVYEVIPAYGGRLFRLDQHLERLENSLRAIRLEPPLTRAQWREILTELLDGAADQAVYLQVTRGVAPKRDHAFPPVVEPTVLAWAFAIGTAAPAPAKAITHEDIRWQWCHIKAITLLANVLLRQEATERGCQEAILIRDGRITEGAASNVFAVVDGVIVTPAKGPHLLPGVTRDLILELARELALPCQERDLDAAELARAEEIWLSSSTRELVPVVELDGEAVGDSRPGPLWRRLYRAFQDYKRRFREQAP
ncbi:D-alanine transaminase [Methylomarinovum caldicuralii]|uniref:Aminodeoxychorismate lyase n=1 Tax=Methylomarinovum caldicuralii TaxID=438856 RepID=A0AAU9C8K2_9GAMM|nr:D-amino acid aminotransferase [Methylomarinovum caldicuralii]BCX80764.1 D-alanine transaminase [Methylomarinovum caldicuralii]